MIKFQISTKAVKYDTVESLSTFIKEIQSNKNTIQELSFGGNSYGIDACKAIASVVKQLDHLTVLHFGDMFTGRLRSEIPICLTSFVDAILSNDKIQLESVDFGDNAFGPDGLNPLVPLIAKQKSLKVLRVNNTGLGPAGGCILAKAISQLADAGGELEVLVCGRSRLENGSMAELGQALAKHASLKELSLPQDGIRPEGIKELMQHLGKCKNLVKLDLQDNTFTAVGAEAMASQLKSWPELVTLNVGDCMMTAKGSIKFLEAFRSTCASIRELNLQYNEINEAGALLLASQVKDKKNLTKLEVNGNTFAADGAAADALRDALDEGVLGTMSDMEEEDSEVEDEEEDEVDALADSLAKAQV